MTTTDPVLDGFMDRFRADALNRHMAQRTAGKHDAECEWRKEGHFLCHCAYRARIASGFTDPPGELLYRSPLCPRCDETVEHDGDGWVCQTCNVTWTPNDPFDEGSFRDHYGELTGHLRIDAARAAAADGG